MAVSCRCCNQPRAEGHRPTSDKCWRPCPKSGARISRSSTLAARFLAEQAGQGVYRYLRFPAGSPVAPYQDASRPVDPTDPLRFHPNERLGDALTPLNWKRIVRKLASQGDAYRQLRYPLLSGML